MSELEVAEAHKIFIWAKLWPIDIMIQKVGREN